MNATKIPFIEKVGVIRNSAGALELPFNKSIHNHLKTVHASAQFTLAETASGDALQTQFPELVGKVIPVLRDSSIKFKKPAQKSITAHASITDEAIDKFRTQLAKKGRALISVSVAVKDSEEVVTCVGTFSWFVQSIA